ncbi:hypothetical protein FHL15_010933 [Xylaria flabelliformis]|uniref:Nucleoporin NSP1-like C-terminal domain-containing protein n=1 Tax=Xylaria flabelliformis TaxID=2512241 RepID=A0A553HJQ8_9PEZI|nr:hypothetical protein FHL15_010933 [Xylaria flabelliformis]
MPLKKLTQETDDGNSGASTSQAPASGGLFGSTANASTAKPASLFGSAPTSQQSQQGTSLFGSTPTTATSQTQSQQTPGQAPASGGLFGSTAAASTPKPGGLFGASSTSQQPQQGTSLFSTTPASQPQSQQTPSLFASAASAQPQQQQQQTGGLFGTAAQTQTQTQPQTQATGSLFGNTNAAGQANTGATASTGLFGGSLSNPSQPANNATGTGLLGQATQPRLGLFGGLGQQTQTQTQPASLGQSQQQQQQPTMGLGGGLGFGLTMGQQNAQPTVPGVRIDVTNLKGTTRFNDLQEDLQKIVEQADNFIAEQVRRKQEVDSFMSGHRQMLESIPDDVTFVSRKYDGARNALESAAQTIEAARALVNEDADNARLSFRAIDNLKLPQQYHTSGFWSPRQQASGTANAESDGQDIVGFFSKAADEMGAQIKKYEGNLTEIELHLHGVSDNLVEQLQRMMASKNNASSGADEKIQELVAVLRDFEQSILKVASDVGSAREGMTRLQLGDFMNNNHNTNGVY